MARWPAILELTRVRVLSFLREPEVLFWVFGFPLIVAAVLGFAFRTTEIAPSRVGLPVAASADALALRLDADAHIEVQRLADEPGARRLATGGIDAWLTPGDPPTLRIDPDRPESELTRLRVLRALELVRDAERAPAVASEAVRERGSRYIDFLFPGLLGMNIMGTGLWLIGLSIADHRQKRVLRRLLVTPMRKSSFLGSLLLARLVWFALEVGLLLVFGMLILDVPFHANAVGFAFLCVLGALSFSGLGMLVCSRVKSIQGASGMLNLALVPGWLFSGVFFSYERFPEVAHPFIRLLPLTALNDALRGSMLDGTGLVALLPEIAVLVVWGVGSFVLALRVFRWE
ncbi:MAG: ABC transporter permease [Planctomycetota bacterium]